MIVALLGDVHGNSVALRAVLDEAAARGAERLLLTGDLVGYYYDAAGVLALLESWDTTIVRGNHEEMLAQWRAGVRRDEIRRRYGSALDVALERLDAATVDELVSLPHPVSVEVDGRAVLLCHGTPGRVDRYLYPDAPPQVWAELAEGIDAELVVYGHTHHPVDLVVGGVRFVNPGSVGQPRDRLPGSPWSLWDTVSGEVTAHRTTWDRAELVAECRRRDPELPYLVDVLERSA